MNAPVSLKTIISFLDETFQTRQIEDFPNACNGLQLTNDGSVTCIVGAVDASVNVINAAIEQKADLLCVHHGLTWRGLQPLTGALYELYKRAIEANLAIYSLHLPLDGHPMYGHNVLIAKALDMSIESPFMSYKGRPYGCVCEGIGIEELSRRLKASFPRSYRAFCYGSEQPKCIAIMSGSGGQECLNEMVASDIDTLVTGEIHYSAISFAQLYQLNLFACGHYATECFGIKALLRLLHEKTQLPCEFIEDFCEL